ncbi:MAG: hypothetical protein JSS01_09800 [Proteobacteria bacterium]|nr:hypothetical protein [Pseudomonadota bacterium]
MAPCLHARLHASRNPLLAWVGWRQGIGRDRVRRKQAGAVESLRAQRDGPSAGDQDVLRGAAAGRLNGQVAAELGVSVTSRVARSTSFAT